MRVNWRGGAKTVGSFGRIWSLVLPIQIQCWKINSRVHSIQVDLHHLGCPKNQELFKSLCFALTAQNGHSK